MNRIQLGVAILLIATALPSSPAAAQEWTRFRGPNGTGQSDTMTIPTRWTDEDYQWRVELPGIGHSSPVIWGERVFVTSAVPETAQQNVICLDSNSGRTLWMNSYRSLPHHHHPQNSFASSTPVVDAERVYVAWGTPDATTLMALDHDGETEWSIELGPYGSKHGFAVSPMLHGDCLILASHQQGEGRNNQTPGESFVIAVDRTTGETVWKTERESEIASYSVPSIFRYPDGREELICCSTANGMYALDPLTGEENWALPIFDKRTVSSPVIVGDTVFGSSGSGGGGNQVVAIQPGNPPTELYRITRQAPYVPMVVAHEELMFLWHDGGIVTCIHRDDGEVLWRERIGGNFSGSPVRVGDYLYCIDQNGVVIVLRASSEYELIARNELGEASRATPAIAGGRMFLRTETHLMAIGGE